MRTVYLETSVISYFAGEISHDVVIAGHQASTRDFWKKLNKAFTPVISALVIREISQGSKRKAASRVQIIEGFNVIDISNEAENLADLLITRKGIPREFPEDALHIALAAVAKVDFIVTWNFKHINNPFTKNKVKEIIEGAGYICPILTSPEELLGELS
ncbi:MAG: type II toxin-antitoxin system VapC family toxin [Victivallales bacterium]|jgi:predicted nucleic acid-binding protein